MKAQEKGVERCVIIGAGPAGLTAAYELALKGRPCVVFEQDGIAGGISRTVNYKGYRCDVGGHRFFTKVHAVRDLWDKLMGPDFLVRPRLSRIYYNNRFFDYPLRIGNTLKGLGIIESMLMGFSYIRARLFPAREEKTFEQWVSNRFGARLFRTFFKSYTEKVWGIPCSEISADWAQQRIKNLNFMAAVKNALLGTRTQGKKIITSLIDQFQYPRLGPGMMWERFCGKLDEKGVPVELNTKVTRIHCEDGRVAAVTVRNAAGEERRVQGDHFISSMPLRDLVNCMEPPPPREVVDAANSLKYRDFITVLVVIDKPDVFPDNWIYVHSPEVKVGRIQNFKNWSPEMVPDAAKTALGLEYFAQEGDALWNMADKDMVALATRECVKLGFASESSVIDGAVIRMPKAYPVYDSVYKDSLAAIRRWLDGLKNLCPIGRNGQHRYNNMDHSMVSAMCAARVVQGAEIDIWDLGVDRAYLEELDGATDEEREEAITEDMIRDTFARYDGVALGVALGVVSAFVIFALSIALILRGGEVIGPTLALLGQYLPGYSVTVTGAITGAVEVAVGMYLFGYLLAHAINWAVGLIEGMFLRRIEILRTVLEDADDGG